MADKKTKKKKKKKKKSTDASDDYDHREKKKTKTNSASSVLKNILICGTPGTGKSTVAKLVLEKANANAAAKNDTERQQKYESLNVIPFATDELALV